MVYECSVYGMMGGNYSYVWMFFGWLMGLLIIVGIVLFIIWIAKKIKNEDNKNKRRLK